MSRKVSAERARALKNELGTVAQVDRQEAPGHDREANAGGAVAGLHGISGSGARVGLDQLTPETCRFISEVGSRYRMVQTGEGWRYEHPWVPNQDGHAARGPAHQPSRKS